DVIFDPIAGETLPVLAQAVALGGQIILYGALQGMEPRYPLVLAISRGFTLRAFTVYAYSGNVALGIPRNEEAFERATTFITANLKSGKLKPLIAKKFRLHEIQDAHRYIESNQQLGKVVVITGS